MGCVGSTTSLASGRVSGDDEVFRALVLARLIEPTSELDTIRVLDEVGVGTSGVPHDPASPARLRDSPATLVLYDIHDALL